MQPGRRQLKSGCIYFFESFIKISLTVQCKDSFYSILNSPIYPLFLVFSLQYSKLQTRVAVKAYKDILEWDRDRLALSSFCFNDALDVFIYSHKKEVQKALNILKKHTIV